MDIYYSGPRDQVNLLESLDHSEELDLLKEYREGYRHYVMEQGEPKVCVPLCRTIAGHEGHLWQFLDRDGNLLCECGEPLAHAAMVPMDKEVIGWY